jgi:[ribosomal protein S5]-alanine N-acetyltransferase
MNQLETARLRLRAFSIDDLQEAHRILDGHPDVWQFDPGYQPSLEKREKLLQFRILEMERHGIGSLAVLLKETEQLIGYCGLQLYLCERQSYSTPEVELFYKLGRDYWGKGDATEAAQAVVRYAFEELRLSRIVSHANCDNHHSVALMRRVGLMIEDDPLYPSEVMGTLDHPSR